MLLNAEMFDRSMNATVVLMALSIIQPTAEIQRQIIERLVGSTVELPGEFSLDSLK